MAETVPLSFSSSSPMPHRNASSWQAKDPSLTPSNPSLTQVFPHTALPLSSIPFAGDPLHSPAAARSVSTVVRAPPFVVPSVV
ncbi:unnamed protein product [Citrullus colocynthis]|uniref:Uncharacterized protein n=1 Tax=Citrullus colocynthis TaxID=252529 RepID=A0ABP0YMB5_9ROSI